MQAASVRPEFAFASGIGTFVSLLLGFGTGSAFAAAVPYLIISRGWPRIMPRSQPSTSD
jgi:hypothetical protein